MPNRCRYGAVGFSPGGAGQSDQPQGNLFIGALVPQLIDLRRSPVEQYLLIAVTLSLTNIVVISF